MSAVRGQITLGQMTMYVLLFRQGQSAVSAILSAIGGMYEDNLYLSTLYEYLDTPVDPLDGNGDARSPTRHDGVRFEHVSFTYPGATEPAVRRCELAPAAGREPGAGRARTVPARPR